MPAAWDLDLTATALAEWLAALAVLADKQLAKMRQRWRTPDGSF